MQIKEMLGPDYLKLNSLFSELSSNELEVIRNHVNYQTANRGQIIDLNWNNSKSIYLIVSGIVKISEIDESGEELVKEVLKEGDLFGDIIDNSIEQQYEFAEAISSRLLLAVFPLRIIKDVVERQPSFGWKYSRMIWDRYKSFETRCKIMALHKKQLQQIKCPIERLGGYR